MLNPSKNILTQNIQLFSNVQNFDESVLVYLNVVNSVSTADTVDDRVELFIRNFTNRMKLLYESYHRNIITQNIQLFILGP